MNEPAADSERRNAAPQLPLNGNARGRSLMAGTPKAGHQSMAMEQHAVDTTTLTFTRGAAESTSGHEDLSDVYFLVADFLRRATPCSRAASVLEEELHALGLLRTAVNWQGDERRATYADVHLRHRNLPATQLVSLLRRSTAGKADGLMRRQEVEASTSEERRSALDTLIHLWRNIRTNERKVHNITLLLEKINLRKRHMSEPDEVDLVAEHRGAKQLVDLKTQLDRDMHTSRSVWRRVEAWGLTHAITTVTPTTNYFRHLRQRSVVGQSHHYPHPRSLHPLQSTPPKFVYSRYRKLKSLSGHLQIPVFCVTYDKTGKYIITGADDRLVKIWSALTGELLYTLHGHVGNITDMDVHPSNGLLVTSSDDKTARVWEISTGFSIAVLVGHTSDVNTSRFHPVQNVVVSASDDGTCCMFRLPAVVAGPSSGGSESKTETVQRLFKQQAYCRNIKPFVVLNHTNAARLNRSSKVVSLAFSPRGDFVATGSQDGMGRVWSIEEFIAESTPPDVPEATTVDEVDAVVNSIPHQVQVSTANFVVQQRVVAAPDVPGAANPHWANSVVVSNPIAVMNGHTQSITTLLFNRRGDAIATASMKDGTSRLWKWSKKFGKVSHTILHGPEMLLATRRTSSELSTDQLIWTSDDSTLVTLHSRKPEVTGKWCQALRVWDPVACKPIRTLSHETLGHANAVFAMDSHPTDARILLTAGYDGRIVIWDIQVGRILRSFQNWESPINTDGCAILDVSFSPSGDEFAATDRAGRLMLFGTGPGDAFQGTPTEQYFSNDYAPIDLDIHLNVVDRETQVQPQLLPRSVLMDMGRNVYPHQPLHLMQPLSPREYQTNVDLRRKHTISTPYFNSIVDQDATEPFVDANFVDEQPAKPLVHHRATAPVHAYRLNGDAVKASELRRRRQQRPAEDPTDRDTSVLNDVLPSSEDDDEDFQVNEAAQVEDDDDDEDEDMDEDDDAGSEDELDGDVVLNGSDSRALRSQRRARQSEDEDDVRPPTRRRRRLVARAQANVVEETKDDPSEPSPLPSDENDAAPAGGAVDDYRENDYLVVESSEGVTVSGNLRDKFDETKPYSQMFAQKSSIVCGFCGRGDQGGMFALPGALMGDFALVNGAQRVFVHDQCAISSPLSFFHDGSWYNVAKELRRGRLLKCFHCGQKGATIGCNTESCKVTIHLPCGMVQGYNVDHVQYFCKTHAAKSAASHNHHPSSISPESFIRRMGHQYDRLYCQQSVVSHELALIPQVGDTLVYCPQGHAVFLRSFPSKFQAAFRRLPRPFAVLQCHVVDIQFDFPRVELYPQQNRIVMQLVLEVTGLPDVYFQDEQHCDVLAFGSFVPVNRSFVQDEAETRPKWRFHLQHQPSECAEFLLLEQKYLSGFQLPRWAVGATVQMAYHTMDEHGMIQATQMDTGRILDLSPLDPAVMSPWECIVVQWENEDTPCRVSPWELESDQTHFAPPTIPERPALLQGLMSIRQLSVAAGFNEPVPTSTPDYHITIANPMDLSLICQRVESSYYRHVDALLADVKLMVRNCETYNVESSLIAQNARSVLTNTMTLLHQLFPSHAWLPDLTYDDEPVVEAGRVELPAAVATTATNHNIQPPARHRPLKRALETHHNASKRSTAERDQRLMQTMRLPVAQREAFQQAVAKGKLVECLIQVHTHAQAEDAYLIFAHPVTDDIAPGYSAIIPQPMDFATMKAKIPQYPSLSAYYDDYMLVVDNAMTYNQPGTLVFTEAKRMKTVLSKCFGRVLGGQKGKAKAKARKYDSDDDDSAESSDSSDALSDVEGEDDDVEKSASSSSESEEADEDDEDSFGAGQRRK
ncbi:hypothetical protein H257_13465 [Aphanomyces astaci]|uniref:Bromodomain and WD repeat-containing protein 1 n=1 Tax=Aphanomyces astaci TaxID=112090 RepID=W4FU93_APHAT|nr:hypothetical protein H257_13465 [Aphanomyces astaci]ETV71037.1 hypothetical protein H257_13465 [Aphanomyces astaci]|eukprot:XP_009839283.1 hypothetical protein H257_13465 [Aphanomyces astaci]